MTRIDQELFMQMSDASRQFVLIWISQNDLPEPVVEMEDTPGGLRVTYLATDEDGKFIMRHGEVERRTMLLPDLTLPWDDPG